MRYRNIISALVLALSLYAVEKGFLDDLPLAKILPFEAGLHAHFATNHKAEMDKIVATGDWNDTLEGVFKAGIAEFKRTGTW